MSLDKLEMAHDWAMNCLKSGLAAPMSDLVIESWQYADAMQSEADKRKITAPDEIPKHERLIPFDESHVHYYIYGRICACGAIKE